MTTSTPAAAFLRSLRFASAFAIAVAAGSASAQSSTAAEHDLSAWARQVPNSRLQQTPVARQLASSEELRLSAGRAIGLGINGRVRFDSTRGLARVVLVDDQGAEYLVYESYPLIAGGDEDAIGNACRETCLLPNVVPAALKVELVDAALDLQAIVTNHDATPPGEPERAGPTAQDMQRVRDAQEAQIVDALNRRISEKGLKWRAGSTEFSRLPYAERARRLTCGAPDRTKPANLQGAEYYVGGILEVLPAAGRGAGRSASAGVLVDAFDWRSRHGANRPGSPYYDGNADGGGWLTPVKNQLCGDCWAHSALGATEALANLYFNQHIDIDLSEQELVSCSGAGGCQGGNTGAALDYVQSAGVVTEACFPESGVDEPCLTCPSPQQRVSIAGYDYIDPYLGEDNIKRRMIAGGPLPFGIPSWWHALVLAGFEKDANGTTVWILKNSWGTSWGENGYGRVIVPLSDIYLTYQIRTPVVSIYAPYSVSCRDADGDGYYNWGISSEGISACGSVRPEKDCDDSDPTLAIMNEDGICTGFADLGVTLTDALDPVTRGDDVVFNAVVRNAGPATVTAAGLDALLPRGLSWRSTTATQGVCTGTSEITCSLGSLAAGAEATVTITARARIRGNKVTQVSASAAESDPSSANNSASVTTRVLPR
jgi:uncharacterized repeat protein (TIGR01451 family)